MPEIEIRPAIADDIPFITKLEHNYETSYVWQMQFNQKEDRNHITTNFRRVRLPRTFRVDYPRSPNNLTSDWTERSGLLVAVHEGEAIGYASLELDIAPSTTWVTDLVVAQKLRRKGIGSALLLAALEWGSNHASRYLVLEMQPKNYPAIQLAQKFGFDFCGYNDRYYTNNDIGIFFAKSLR